MLRRMAVLQLLLYVRIKGGDVGRVTWYPWVVDEGGGRKQSRESDKKANDEPILLLHPRVRGS